MKHFLALTLYCAARTSAAAPPWPYDGFSRFPSLWFGGNDTRVDDAATLAVVSRFALAGIGWQQGTTRSNYSHLEAEVWAAARAVAAFAAQAPLPPGATAPLPVFVYRNAQICWAAFDVQSAFMQDAANDAAFWHDPVSGGRCEMALNSTGGHAAYFLRWGDAKAREFFVDGEVADAAAEDGVNAVFFDECDWNVCNMNFKYDGCPSLNSSLLVPDQADKTPALVGAAALLNAHGKVPIFSLDNFLAAAWDGLPPAPLGRPCAPNVTLDGLYDALDAAGVTAMRFYEFFMSGNVSPSRPNRTVSAAYNAATIANAILEGARGIGFVARVEMYPLTNCSGALPPADGRCTQVSASAGGEPLRPGLGQGGGPYHPIPDLEFAVAAFLVVQAPYTYLGGSTGWYSSCWCYLDVYDRAAQCGAPLAPAVRTGAYTWTRAFKGCDVTVDTEAGSGSIAFATQLL